MLRMTPVALALSMAWGLMPLNAAAQTDTAQASPSAQTTAAQLKGITVTSTRTERRVDDVPNVVTVVTQDDVAEKGARDIKDMFKDELGVSIRKQPQRFGAALGSTGRAGAESINIRGIEGNRVLMTLDGIRVPDSFSYGPMQTSRGDYIDVDMLKTAEILRGPASSQYGSDGLAGAVAFRTLDPIDLLKHGQNIGGFARTNYTQVDNSYGVLAGVAGQNDTIDAMVVVGHRKGHETETNGDNDSRTAARTKANPSDYDSTSVLAKANLKINANNTIGLAIDAFERKQDTEIYSGRTATVTDVAGQDKLTRTRVALNHKFIDFNSPFIQRAETNVYWQESEINQFTAETRPVAGNRTRDNTHQTKAVGLNTVLESNFSNQKVSYGVDWNKSQIMAVRDGSNALGAAFVTSKPFPDTDYTLAGAFLQDEIELGNVSIIPGVRFDYYKLAAKSTQSYTGSLISMSGTAVTPRIGAVWRLTPLFAPFAEWSKGFKAPTPDQVNTSFENNMSFYQVIGNPNLKPEKSNSFELGFRGKNEMVSYSVSAFKTNYDNFISQELVSGSMTPVDPAIFQYINLGKVNIHGLEARSSLKVTSAVTLTAGLAYAKGNSESHGTSKPLDTIDPFKATLGVRYDVDNWGAFADVTHVNAKSQDRISDATYFATPSYTVLDIGARWKPVRNLTISANLNNLFDRKYWNWSDVRSLSSSSPALDAYTSPGRNAQVSLRYDF